MADKDNVISFTKYYRSKLRKAKKDIPLHKGEVVLCLSIGLCILLISLYTCFYSEDKESKSFTHTVEIIKFLASFFFSALSLSPYAKIRNKHETIEKCKFYIGEFQSYFQLSPDRQKRLIDAAYNDITNSK